MGVWTSDFMIGITSAFNLLFRMSSFPQSTFKTFLGIFIPTYKCRDLCIQYRDESLDCYRFFPRKEFLVQHQG